MTSPVLQPRVPESTLDPIDQACGDDTRSAWLQRLIDRELNGQPAVPVTTGTAPVILPAGEPCPGAVCSAPGCWQRDTEQQS